MIGPEGVSYERAPYREMGGRLLSASMARNGIAQLALCALAIYTMFLLWGLLQEKRTLRS